ncbi:MAG: LysM peptidoglycan-binding domain-containing protein [Candidatus Dormibacteraceae bacterium]
MTVVSRYVVHAVVLAIAALLSGYATVTHQLPASASVRFGIVNAAGLVLGQGGQVGDVTLGRMSTVIKPITVPTSAPSLHTPISYTVGHHESLQAIAAKFNLSVDEIRWSNPSLADSMAVHAGQKLALPPIQGVVVAVKKGDTAQSIASVFHVDVKAVIDFNYLRDPAHLAPGTTLIVPSGQGNQFFDEQPTPVTLGASSLSEGGIIMRISNQPGGRSGGHFPYGYCTWYVNNRRPVPWSGDAWQWYGAAQSYGWPVGQKARPGAIMVTWESGWGHVAYVESVHADGSWTVSEMNYRGWAVVDQRTIRPGQVPLIGFIY